MNAVVVHRAAYGLPGNELFQILHHKVGIEGVGVVVVQGGALLVGHAAVGFVVVVVVDNAHVLPEGVLQPLGQGGFAGTGSPGDANHHGFHEKALLCFYFSAHHCSGQE